MNNINSVIAKRPWTLKLFVIVFGFLFGMGLITSLFDMFKHLGS